MRTFSLCTILIFLLSSFQTNAAKEGYEIKITVKGLADTTCYLANFYGKNQFYKDTAKVDANGFMVFDGPDELDQGLHTLVIGNKKIIDFLVIEQHFTIETDTADYLSTIKIKGSEENRLFYEYIGFLNVKQKEAQTSQENNPENVERLKKLDKEVKQFQKDFIKLHEGKFVSKFIKGMTDVEIPDAPKNEDGTTDSTFQFNYYKEHYFDHMDFSDGRFVRTPIYHNLISKYLQKLTIQTPDSLIKEIDYVVALSRANYDLFRYTVSWITNTYEKSKIMGLDAIFVHMAENYYLTGEADWIDSAQTAKIEERFTKMKPLLIGKKAPNVMLADSTQKTWYNLHQLDSEYTIVYIWSPTCGHCKKVTPKMHDLYLKYKDKGLNVFAIGTEFENKEWKKYIVDHKLSWINVSDSPEYPNNIKDHPNNFRENYDVFSTPKIYLLDKDKKIIAKKLEDEQLDDLIGKLIDEKQAK